MTANNEREAGRTEPNADFSQAGMVQMATGFLMARAIHTVVELGIADFLSDGPKSVEDLAQASGAHEESLYRLLRMLSARQIFTEDSNGHFHLTPSAETLRSGVPGSIRGFVRMMDEAWWKACGDLLYSVKTGKPSFDHAYGMNHFEYLMKYPEANKRFDAGMATASKGEDTAVAEFYDFSQFERVMDIGGGRGGLIAEVLKAHPTAAGVLYDQAQVVADPRKLKEAQLMERCDVIGGNFFESIPSGGDVYLLKKILHDWDDETSIALLRRCREAMNEDGRVLVVDTVIPPGNDPHPGKETDVLMMVMLGGRERTENEFRALYQKAGLELTRIIPTPSMLSIVEGKLA